MSDIHYLITVTAFTWWFLAVLYRTMIHNDHPADDWLDDFLAEAECDTDNALWTSSVWNVEKTAGNAHDSAPGVFPHVGPRSGS
jgi:hypothetical protein